MGSLKDSSQQTKDIRNAVTQINKSLVSFESVIADHDGKDGVEHKGAIAEARNALSHDAVILAQTVRGPTDTVYDFFEKTSQASAIRSLIAMEAFDKIPVEGSITVDKLAAEVGGVDRNLLGRLLRILSVIGPFREVGEDEFAHTDFSKAYLIPEIRGMFTLIADEMMGPWVKMHEFLSSNGWQTPLEEGNNPYTYAHQTGGRPIWAHLKQYPERVKALNLGMGAQTETSMWSVDIVDFNALLASKKTNKDDVLVVDVGGGKGHCLQRIDRQIPDIQGRLVLQDRPEVICDTYDLDSSRIDKYEYNFFEPQPIKGAHIYYIRRVLHDWSDEKCVEILKVIAAAMEPGKSRLIIAEIVVPPTGVDSETGWMDLVLMTVTGMERSQKIWQEILDASGLKLEKVYTAAGTNHGAVQAVLK